MDIRKELITLAATNATVCLLAAAKLMQEKEQRQKGRIRPCWIKRVKGNAHDCTDIPLLLKEFKLVSDLDGCRSYLLMDELCFEELLEYVGENISRRDSNWQNCLPPQDRLAITLRFLAEGESLKDLQDETKLSPSFLATCIQEVCEGIYRSLKDSFLKFPDHTDELLKIAEELDTRYKFPNCLGAVDRKHIRLSETTDQDGCNDASIVLIAMADASSKFTFVDIIQNGSLSDDEIFMHSNLCEILLGIETPLPSEKLVEDNIMLPYVVVAGEEFPVMENLLTPYTKACAGDVKLVHYNYCLNKVRQCVEQALSVMTDRFKVLQKTFKLSAQRTEKIVLCCCALHNFLIERSSSYAETNVFLPSPPAVTVAETADSPSNKEINSHSQECNIDIVRRNFVEHLFNLRQLE